jgi:mono/diheme cytochrome c family protein
LIVAFAFAAVVAGCTSEREAPEQGAALYRDACAGCHGADAHGKGPIAPLLKVEVPDLTRIASRRGGRFPADEIYRIVDGQAPHGERHMPAWGFEFFASDAEDDRLAHDAAARKIERLVEHLRAIQE